MSTPIRHGIIVQINAAYAAQTISEFEHLLLLVAVRHLEGHERDARRYAALATIVAAPRQYVALNRLCDLLHGEADGMWFVLEDVWTLSEEAQKLCHKVLTHYLKRETQ